MNIDQHIESIKNNRSIRHISFIVLMTLIVLAAAATLDTCGAEGLLAPTYIHATWTNSAYDKNAYFFTAFIGIMLIVLTFAIVVIFKAKITGNKEQLATGETIQQDAIASINNEIIDNSITE